jgi:NAD-dependent DNA ligase
VSCCLRRQPDQAAALGTAAGEGSHVLDDWREAAARIVEFGADFRSNVSTKVDMLVIGDADFVQFADGMQTGKMKKAAEIKEDGHDIEVMAERDFLSMLRS